MTEDERAAIHAAAAETAAAAPPIRPEIAERIARLLRPEKTEPARREAS